MLAILFYVGDQTFAVDCSYILEIIPLIKVQHVSHIGKRAGGVINFNGRHVTIFDFTQLIDNRPSANFLTTRIIILTLQDKQAREPDPSLCFGLIVEKAVELTDIDSVEATSCSFNPRNEEILEGFAQKDERTIQVVDIPKLYSLLKAECYADKP